jgi:hypothetical protein
MRVELRIYKMHVRETTWYGMDSIHLSLDRYKLLTVVKNEMKLSVP